MSQLIHSPFMTLGSVDNCSITFTPSTFCALDPINKAEGKDVEHLIQLAKGIELPLISVITGFSLQEIKNLQTKKD